jgi:LSD1 subclass zinc finger protein
VCKGCGGNDLDAAIGRYGPYAKCRSCNTNTAVRVTCDGCREPVRLNTGADGFEGACDTCGRRFEVAFGGGLGHEGS